MTAIGQNSAQAFFFRGQLVRLRRAGVLVFIVKGNHDAESQITKQLPDVEYFLET